MLAFYAWISAIFVYSVSFCLLAVSARRLTTPISPVFAVQLGGERKEAKKKKMLPNAADKVLPC